MKYDILSPHPSFSNFSATLGNLNVARKNAISSMKAQLRLREIPEKETSLDRMQQAINFEIQMAKRSTWFDEQSPRSCLITKGQSSLLTGVSKALEHCQVKSPLLGSGRGAQEDPKSSTEARPAMGRGLKKLRLRSKINVKDHLTHPRSPSAWIAQPSNSSPRFEQGPKVTSIEENIAESVCPRLQKSDRFGKKLAQLFSVVSQRESQSGLVRLGSVEKIQKKTGSNKFVVRSNSKSKELQSTSLGEIKPTVDSSSTSCSRQAITELESQSCAHSTRSPGTGLGKKQPFDLQLSRQFFGQPVSHTTQTAVWEPNFSLVYPSNSSAKILTGDYVGPRKKHFLSKEPELPSFIKRRKNQV